jgi:hypothetical protein
VALHFLHSAPRRADELPSPVPAAGTPTALEIQLPHDVSIVSNHAALVGSVRVWDLDVVVVGPHA